MKLAVLKERKAGETRVATTPDAVKKYVAAGLDVAVEAGAGLASGISDDAYSAAGARIGVAAEVLANAQIVLCVSPPDITQLPFGAMLAGLLDPTQKDALLPQLAARNITAFALELLPRISRAQSMDVLSSQGNLAGYRAAIEAVHALPKATPLMMTAAGTVPPAQALVLGAGVAGLQAIATLKRLGAVVSAFDVRAAAKEQVESLGARFIAVAADAGDLGETVGGYAKETSEDYQRRQRQLIHETIVKQNIAIATAMIPGKRAPILITEEMVTAMRPGAVIVDMAAGSGGNCVLTEPGRTVVKYGVTIIGDTNLPARLPLDASALYARNIYNFVTTLLTPELKWEDELIKATLLTKSGANETSIKKGIGVAG